MCFSVDTTNILKRVPIDWENPVEPSYLSLYSSHQSTPQFDKYWEESEPNSLTTNSLPSGSRGKHKGYSFNGINDSLFFGYFIGLHPCEFTSVNVVLKTCAPYKYLFNKRVSIIDHNIINDEVDLKSQSS